MEETISFGYWLRRRRKALDLTQAAVAQRVGCAKTTIQKLELEERRPSREMAQQLAQVLAIPPPERAIFVQCARGGCTTDHVSGLPVPPGGVAVGMVPIHIKRSTGSGSSSRLPLTTCHPLLR